jgi:hypothetical protein
VWRVVAVFFLDLALLTSLIDLDNYQQVHKSLGEGCYEHHGRATPDLQQQCADVEILDFFVATFRGFACVHVGVHRIVIDPTESGTVSCGFYLDK